MTANDYPLQISDFIEIIMRRRWHVIIPATVVLLIAIALAFLLPPTYRSESTILIERQAVPQNMIQTTVTGYVQEQIQQIRQQIATYDNLLNLADKHLLYPELFEKDPGAVVSNMRENFDVEMVEVKASDPNRTGIRLATIAFNVSFEADDPVVSQAVTQDLTDKFLEYHAGARQVRAQGVTAFLEDEVEKLAEEIGVLERQMAQFKQDEMQQLPELMTMNLRLFESTEAEIERTETRIRGLNDRLDAYRAEISLTPVYEEVRDEQGGRVLTAAERLSALTASYLRASARYSSSHPDVVRLSREIRILAEQTGSAARADELMSELVTLQEDLRQSRQRYGAGHPEVQRLEKAVAAVQRGFESAVISVSDEAASNAPPPDNPRYVGLQTQINSTVANVAAEQATLAELKVKLAEYEARLFQTPNVEAQFKTLSRDYENAQRKYRELRDKQLEAELAEEIEAGDKAERWVIANNAFRPVLPESPNRIGIILLGMLFGVGLSLGVVTVAEYTDKTIRYPRNVTTLLGVPPLAAIPKIPEAA